MEDATGNTAAAEGPASGLIDAAIGSVVVIAVGVTVSTSGTAVSGLIKAAEGLAVSVTGTAVCAVKIAAEGGADIAKSTTSTGRAVGAAEGPTLD